MTGYYERVVISRNDDEINSLSIVKPVLSWQIQEI